MLRVDDEGAVSARAFVEILPRFTVGTVAQVVNLVLFEWKESTLVQAADLV